MTVFEKAVGLIHRDKNMRLTATYQFGGDAPVACTVLYWQDTEEMANGPMISRISTHVFEVRSLQVTPKKGGVLVVDTLGTFKVKEAPERIDDALSWKLSVTEQ